MYGVVTVNIILQFGHINLILGFVAGVCGRSMGSLVMVQITDLHLINDYGPKLILWHLANLGSLSVYMLCSSDGLTVVHRMAGGFPRRGI